MTNVLMKRGNLCTLMSTGRRPREDEGGNRGNASIYEP